MSLTRKAIILTFGEIWRKHQPPSAEFVEKG